MAPLELVYKQVDELDLYLDVYVPSSATPSAPVPVILWWHGGGLIQGTRKGSLDVPQPEPHMLHAPETHDICVVSADYRLAPQTRMPGILADCADAMAFVRSLAFKEATGSCVDASRLFVSGSSAGGWLALLTGTGIGYAACGLEAPPTPTGILAIYPITDLQHSFWNMKHRPVSYRSDIISHEEMAAYMDPDQPKVAFASFHSTRNIFYHYMVQEGILTSLLLEGTGVSPSSFSIATSLEECPLLRTSSTGPSMEKYRVSNLKTFTK
ncbi:Alpha/Beta hydrolase protein [Mucidula mucida]|nr:Alpha/Beta hydrolase protein [Mucidula mucida]